MLINRRLLSIWTILFASCCFFGNYSIHAEEIKTTTHTIKPTQHSITPYLLPDSHPLQPYLISIFTDKHMFRSIEHFKKAGFKVKVGHKNLMVGAHPSIPGYLFKKFSDRQSQVMQTNNYVKRIKGAKIVSDMVKKLQLKHIIVPQKWVYALPRSFTNGQVSKSYLLIVENMDIFGTEDNLKLYYNMDIEILTELCTLLHALGGCDAFPRNQPFTRSGKIAFVDTEHVGGMKDHFTKHVVPALNKDLQAYGIALWEKLEAEQKAREHPRH